MTAQEAYNKFLWNKIPEYIKEDIKHNLYSDRLKTEIEFDFVEDYNAYSTIPVITNCLRELGYIVEKTHISHTKCKLIISWNLSGIRNK